MVVEVRSGISRGRSRGRGWGLAAPIAVALGVVLLAPRAARAQVEPPRGAERSPDELKAQAEAQFRKGLALLAAQDHAAALAEFLASRRLYPTWRAAYNAAICLQSLTRREEALDLFEVILRDFGERMPPETRDAVQRAVVELRGLVGTIEIHGAEIGAAINVDRRDRGEYPTPSPVRVASGSHVVRVYKEGFEPFETLVDVAGDQTVRVEARLRALVASGLVQISERKGASLRVVVDGNVVGTTPWIGRLAVGDHLVLLRGEGALGTLPRIATVRRNQPTVLTLAAEELDAPVRIEPVPADAEVAIDAVAVGRGAWEGQLSGGPHTIEVASVGFLPESQQVDLERGKARVLAVTLQRDPSSPFWRKPPRRPRFFAEISTGVPILPSFGGVVNDSCVECSPAIGLGLTGVLRGGYEGTSRVAFGVLAGYLTARQAVSGRATEVLIGESRQPSSGLARDVIEIHGAIAGGWVQYTFGEQIYTRLRFDLGAATGSAEDTRTFTSRDRAGNLYTLGPLQVQHTATFLYAAPELRLSIPLSPKVEMSAGLGLPVLVGIVRARWDPGLSGKAGSDGQGSFAADALLGAVVVAVLTSVGARYDF